MASLPLGEGAGKPGPLIKVLVLKKGDHRYHFQYQQGEEIALFYTLMEYAIDDRFNITIKDLVHATSRILKQLTPEAVLDLDQLGKGKAA